MCVVLRVLIMRRNASRRKAVADIDSGASQVVRLDPCLHWSGRLADAVQAGEVVSHDAAFSDLTDMQNTKAFRYIY